MELLAGIFLVIIGFKMLIKPKGIWRISESWKNKRNVEPTILYIRALQILGCILVVLGVTEIIDFIEGI
ncbi:DUF6199 family natural product biosynthesis protein [Clostridium cellulovorans]|uniref:DUF6199 domain-containing protein n=1 Tax=Clostridium cellulovorans (strain ATCC 35296 / DSM 3052 / OCM 3 / 743B) TaxID=573061 RepID=D9SMQ8_CLOC7|nr:DUF6199 family natural product biosynthesis protein [Clostridium cellulovorans]ADL49843.1 hypothetical protein Clocel_0054 [Clostridium cellulovorans 743B]